MNSIANAFSGLFSLSGLIAFLFGAGATRAYYWFKCSRWNRRHPDKKQVPVYKSLTLLWALIFIVMGYIGMQEQETANDVRRLSNSTVECQRQFNEALRARASISEDNDKWSYIQRKAIGDWLHEILLPPPDIARLRNEDPTNPRIQQWGLDVTRYYNNIIQKTQVEQDQNMQERLEHPLPETTCGRQR